jgi:fumarate hydratase subunit alpha
MRQISVKEVEKTIYESFLKANTELPEDIAKALHCARDKETNELAKFALDTIIENAKIAKDNKWPMCQDTGMAVVFLEVGQEIAFIDGDINKAINNGVRKAYDDGGFRASVADPLTRKNTRDNTPAVIHYEIIPGNELRITVAPKGFGSENMSKTYMLNPTSSKEEIIKIVVDTVKEAGGKPCPPIIVGLGIGGTMEKATYIAKKALLRDLDKANEDPEIACLERQLLNAINNSMVGVQGFGGINTALGVSILTFPTHIAGLPIAINIQCHAARHYTKVL